MSVWTNQGITSRLKCLSVKWISIKWTVLRRNAAYYLSRKGTVVSDNQWRTMSLSRCLLSPACHDCVSDYGSLYRVYSLNRSRKYRMPLANSPWSKIFSLKSDYYLVKNHFFPSGNRLYSAPVLGIVVRDRSEFANISTMLDVRTGKLKKVKSILPVSRMIMVDPDFFFMFDISSWLV